MLATFPLPLKKIQLKMSEVLGARVLAYQFMDKEISRAVVA